MAVQYQLLLPHDGKTQVIAVQVFDVFDTDRNVSAVFDGAQSGGHRFEDGLAFITGTRGTYDS